MKFRNPTSILLGMTCLLAFLGCTDPEDSGDLEISIPVSVQSVAPQAIDAFVTTSGTVEAIKNTILKSEVAGDYRLARNPATGKPFAPGDRVKKGQTVINLVNPEYENNIQIESHELNLDISKREFEKQNSLYEKGGITLRELKTAERTYIDAKYSYNNARIQLGKLQIKAPFTGTIVELPYYTPNTRVEAAQTMVKLMDYDLLHSELSFPARELTRIKVGQPVHVTHHAMTEDTLQGTVTRVSPALDSETRSFKVSVEVDNKTHILRPGMFVRINTVVDRKDSTIVIPREIILSKRRGKTVYVVEKGAAFERILSTGLENSDEIEILEGLKEGDRLVVRGFETLRNSSKVKILN